MAETENFGEYKLEHFWEAQEDKYAVAKAEIEAGVKQGHWMWFVFPQLKGLGISYLSKYYGIRNIEEAREYLEEPVLRGVWLSPAQYLKRYSPNFLTGRVAAELWV